MSQGLESADQSKAFTASQREIIREVGCKRCGSPAGTKCKTKSNVEGFMRRSHTARVKTFQALKGL